MANDNSRFWLMKSEPEVFSIDDLANRPGQTTSWDGVRNYQARNFMRDEMKLGDRVLFYHSNCKVPGVVGIAEVCSSTPHPDKTQFDPHSEYFDPKATPENPRWMLVDVKFIEKFPRTVSLREIKDDPELSKMKVAQRGQRLSVQPVEKCHYDEILKRAGK